MRSWGALVCLILTLSANAATLQEDTTLQHLYNQALSHKVSNPNLSLAILDSLISNADNEKNAPIRIKAMLLKSETLRLERRFDEALEELKKAKQQTKDYPLSKLEGSILEATGYVYKEKNADSARYYYELAYAFFEKSRDSTSMSSTLTRLSHVYMDQGKFTIAMQFLNKAELLIREDDYIRKLNLLTNKAHNYSAVGLEVTSIAASRNAIALIEKHHITEKEFNVSASYGNICDSYLNINKADSAYYFANRSVTSLDKISPNSPFLITLGNIYLALDSATQALEAFNKYAITKKITDYYFLKLDGLFNGYHKLNDADNIKKIAMEILSLMPEEVPRKRTWMKIYKSAGKAAAYLKQKELVYLYQEKYFEHYQGIYNQENLAAMLQMDFEEKLKDEKIRATLEAELLKTELKYNRMRQWGLFIGAVLLTTILFLVFVRYRYQKRFNRLLKEKVSKRTLELSIKNAQLSEYAFINAHKLRAPVARIMGLVNVYELKDSDFNITKLFDMLKQEVHALDLIVRSITEAVEEKKVFTREDVGNKN